MEDKLKIVRLLDRLGVQYIEAGNPAANQKDAMFFQRARGLKLQHAKLAAFGSTCRKGVPPYEDENIKALLAADTPVVCVFGKCWDYHVERILGADLLENLGLIADTVGYLKGMGKEVVFEMCIRDRNQRSRRFPVWMKRFGNTLERVYPKETVDCIL